MAYRHAYSLRHRVRTMTNNLGEPDVHFCNLGFVSRFIAPEKVIGGIGLYVSIGDKDETPPGDDTVAWKFSLCALKIDITFWFGVGDSYAFGASLFNRSLHISSTTKNYKGYIDINNKYRGFHWRNWMPYGRLTSSYLCIYIYVCVRACVCVCACVCVRARVRAGVCLACFIHQFHPSVLGQVRQSHSPTHSLTYSLTHSLIILSSFITNYKLHSLQ